MSTTPKTAVAGSGWLAKEFLLPGAFSVGDVVGVGLPGAAVAWVPEPGPELGAGGRLPGQEVVHGLGPSGQHGEQFLALGLVQAVGVGEQGHPVAGVAALVAGVGGQRAAALEGRGD